MPAPFGPEQAEHLTAAHLERQVAHGDEAVLVRLGDALEPQRHVLAVGLDRRHLPTAPPAPQLGDGPAQQAERDEHAEDPPPRGAGGPLRPAADLGHREPYASPAGPTE